MGWECSQDDFPLVLDDHLLVLDDHLLVLDDRLLVLDDHLLVLDDRLSWKSDVGFELLLKGSRDLVFKNLWKHAVLCRQSHITQALLNHSWQIDRKSVV